MIWQKRSPYCLASECGRYKISKTYTYGVPLYTVWLLATKTSLGHHRTASESQEAAATHAQAAGIGAGATKKGRGRHR